MNILKCNNNHFYDRDIFTTCPYCNKKDNNTSEAVASDDKSKLSTPPAEEKNISETVTSDSKSELSTPPVEEKNTSETVTSNGKSGLSTPPIENKNATPAKFSEETINTTVSQSSESFNKGAVKTRLYNTIIKPNSSYIIIIIVVLTIIGIIIANNHINSNKKDDQNTDTDIEINTDNNNNEEDSEQLSAETVDNDTNVSQDQTEESALPEITWNGKYVVFGRYEQDGIYSNGPEPIEWEVLDTKDGRMLLISRYILDSTYDDEDYSTYKWEKCRLRKWLNNDFLNYAFTPEEQNMIPTVTISNPDNIVFGTDGGGKTEDKVFFLSVEDILNYYSFDFWDNKGQYGFCRKLMTEATQYAINNGLDITHTITADKYKNYYSKVGYGKDCIGLTCGWWWLRSPGKYGDPPRGVDFDGDAGWGYEGLGDRQGRGIRPAIYIDL